MSQQSNEAYEQCSVCLLDLDSDRWTIPCKHKFHLKCIKRVYRATKGGFLDGHPLAPSCPLCRSRIHARDLKQKNGEKRRASSSITPQNLEQIIDEPSFVATPSELRPVRLARSIVILESEERRRALDILIERRAQLLHRDTPSEPTRRPRVIVESSPEPSQTTSQQVAELISSQGSIPCFENPSPPSFLPPSPRSRLPLPTYSEISRRTPSPVLLTNTQRSRTPNSQVLQQVNSQTNRTSQELGEVQREINVIHEQLFQIAEFPLNQGSSDFPINIDDESDISEDEADLELDPKAIVGIWGRGRNTHYRILWSDGSTTLNKTREVELVAPEILVAYRRKNRARNTQLCRERMRTAKERENQ